MQKTWFITGASSGFGRLWARAAAERGDRVAAIARDVSRLAPLVEDFGEMILPLALDVTDRAGVFEAVHETIRRFGRIDVLVNSAGYGHWGMVEELTEPELRAQLETNFFGATWVTQAVLPVMRRQGAGHIVQVTSEGGVRAYPGVGAYHASKWALEGLTESLAQEMASFGIAVTCLEPGPYETGFGGAIHASEHVPDYEDFRASNAPEFTLGRADATIPALLQLVDSERPPRRLVLGQAVDAVIEIHEERLQTWRDWRDVSLSASGIA